jgi:hypothetical protein
MLCMPALKLDDDAIKVRHAEHALRGNQKKGCRRRVAPGMHRIPFDFI